MIEKLTPEQEAKLEVYAKKWEQIGLSTEPSDRERAERAVCRVYRDLGHPEPEEFFWIDSPITIQYEKSLAAFVYGDSVSASQRVKHRSWEAAIKIGVSEFFTQSKWKLFESIDLNLRKKIVSSVNSSQKVASFTDILNTVSVDYPYLVWKRGQEDAFWLGAYDFVSQECGVSFETLQGIKEAAESCGGWYPMNRAVVFIERPKELHFDEAECLHNPNGPACLFRDGSGIYCWHGVTTDKETILHPETLSIQNIENERNLERRMVMIERYGHERFVKDSGAVEISSDEFGTLYSKEYQEQKGILQPVKVLDFSSELGDLYTKEYEAQEDLLQTFRVVKVKNSTPEPDGSYKYYYLSVPPHIKTPREGVAWSFGYDNPEDYCPDIET